MSDDRTAQLVEQVTKQLGVATKGITDGEEEFLVEHAIQQAAVGAVRPGVTAQEIDGVARSIIADAGFGDFFIHRTGHGIGMEAHEDPYMIEGNEEAKLSGHAFSVEPGIYVAGRWGARLEDIVVATDDGADSLNQADHALASVEA